jgi:hypothetical protein
MFRALRAEQSVPRHSVLTARGVYKVDSYHQSMISEDSLRELAAKYGLVSNPAMEGRGYVWTNASGKQVIIHIAGSAVFVAAGLNALVPVKTIDALEQYLLRMDFVYPRFSETEICEFAGKNELILKVIEGVGCSLSTKEGKRVILIYNSFVFNGNLIIGKDTVKRFANISELERGISNLGLIPRSKGVGGGGGGSFKSELYTPRPSWLHLGHELQSIERRIDCLLL